MSLKIAHGAVLAVPALEIKDQGRVVHFVAPSSSYFSKISPSVIYVSKSLSHSIDTSLSESVAMRSIPTALRR